MYSLFIDTHDHTRMAIYQDKQLLNQKYSSVPNQSMVLIKMLQQLLVSVAIKIKEIDEIIVVNGPGSFTGIRLGITVAKTLAYNLQIPIKTITSLQLMAIVTDFKRDEYLILDSKGGYLGKRCGLHLKSCYVPQSELIHKSQLPQVYFKLKKLFKYEKLFSTQNPLTTNPIYLKQIEVLNDH